MFAYIFPLLLVVISNCFMTLAWYSHLKFLHNAPIWQAVIFGWFIALLEYSFMIPATRYLAAQGFLFRADENHPRGDYVACFCAVSDLVL